MDTYLSAAVSAGINTSSLDQDLALHLVDLFTQWHTQYHTAMSLLRQTMPHTVEEVLTAANLEYDANPTRKTQQGPMLLSFSPRLTNRSTLSVCCPPFSNAFPPPRPPATAVLIAARQRNVRER